MSDDWPDDRRIRETRRQAAERIMAGLTSGMHKPSKIANARNSAPECCAPSPTDLARHDAYFGEHQAELARRFGIPMPLPKGVTAGDDPEADPL